jgi:hypothetical protein
MAERDAGCLFGHSASPPTVLMKAPFSLKAAAWTSAIAAFFSLHTALSVYEGEERRLHFEKMRLTSQTYQDYIKRVTERPSTFPCLEVLVALEAPELDRLLRYTPQSAFEYDATRHQSLASCLKIVDPTTNALEQGWSDDKRLAIRKLILVEITALDAALVPYLHKLGDKGVVCRNFAGFFRTGGRLLARFVTKLKDAQLVNNDNLPNLTQFHSDLEQNKDICPAVQDVEAGRSVILEIYQWVISRLRLVGLPL